MKTFKYRALTQAGELVTGSINASSATEVGKRVEYLGLLLVDQVTEQSRPRWDLKSAFTPQPRPEDVTVFTQDLALLLRAGARLNDALALLSAEADTGRLKPVVAKIHAAVLSGETFSDALAEHSSLFPELFVALVRVGEMSGSLDRILEAIANERRQIENLRRKLGDALRYPAFLVIAAATVLIFFLTYVLPQFEVLLRDFTAKLDTTVLVFLSISRLLREHTDALLVVLVLALLGTWFVSRQRTSRTILIRAVSRMPVIRTNIAHYRTALLCRNLGVLLSNAVPVSATLRILVSTMSALGNGAAWKQAADRVRHGGKISDALSETGELPMMAIRMIRIGEETGQLAMLAGRVADYYEAKLERSLTRMVGIAGPAAIVFISAIVGGLIISVMTSLLSVYQVVG